MSAWTTKPLKELGLIQTGNTPKTSEKDNFGNDVPFIKPSDFHCDGSLNYFNEGLSNKALENGGARLIKSGSVLMVCIGATIGKVGWCDRDITANQQINSLTPYKNINTKFIYYQMLLKSFQKDIKSNAGQATLPIINKSKWSNLTLAVADYKEQKRIVAILDEAFAGISQAIANTEKNLANARELFESYLNYTFEQGQSIWQTYKIEEVCESIIDCVNKTAPQVDETTPYKMIRTSNVKKGRINLDKVKYVSKEVYDIWTRRQVPQHGDIILTREAPMGEVGMLLLEEDEKVFLGQRLVSYRVNSEKLNNQFLLYAFQSTVMQKQIASFASGSTVQHMRVPDTKILKISIPTLDDQSNIVKKLNDLKKHTSNLEDNLKQKLQSLAELKQSLLQKAFSGELTANNVDKWVNP